MSARPQARSAAAASRRRRPAPSPRGRLPITRGRWGGRWAAGQWERREGAAVAA